jgi:hypothetical protein
LNQWQQATLFTTIILILSLGSALTYFTLTLVISNGFPKEQNYQTDTQAETTSIESPANADNYFIVTLQTNSHSDKEEDGKDTSEPANNAEKITYSNCNAKKLLKCSPTGCECR